MGAVDEGGWAWRGGGIGGIRRAEYPEQWRGGGGCGVGGGGCVWVTENNGEFAFRALGGFPHVIAVLAAAGHCSGGWVAACQGGTKSVSTKVQFAGARGL